MVFKHWRVLNAYHQPGNASNDSYLTQVPSPLISAGCMWDQVRNRITE